MESVWSVSKLSTESVGSRRQLVANCVHTADADATKQFRRVGVGGVYWVEADCHIVRCSLRGGCDSVTWCCIRPRSPWEDHKNLEVQRYNTWTTERHQRQFLQFLQCPEIIWHRRLRADVSGVCRRFVRVYLASVGRRRWHRSLDTGVPVRKDTVCSDTVGDISSPAVDVEHSSETGP